MNKNRLPRSTCEIHLASRNV